MCKDCFTIYIKENPGWCPYCTRHLMYFGLSQSSLKSEGMKTLFNVFVGEQMRNSIKQTNVVATIPMTHLAEKWASFVQHHVYGM